VNGALDGCIPLPSAASVEDRIARGDDAG